VALGLLTPARAYLSQGSVRRFLENAGSLSQNEPDPSFQADEVRRMRTATREFVSPLEDLERLLHPWVAFVIMPLFALANAGVPISAGAIADPVAVAVATGLVVGKPVGILAVSFLAVRTGLARLPQGVGWGAIGGGGLLAGIGFTMALFIASLALAEPLLSAAKVGILAASALAAVAGMIVLLVVLPRRGAGPAAAAPGD
jgi:NhaA family Na+:H+ antiporter